MNVLVTGGAGFIGSALVRHLIRHTGHRVCNLDKLTYAGNLESVASVANDPRYRFAQLDICDAVNVRNLFAEFKPDVIFHLAAETHVDRSITDPGAFIRTNVEGTHVLLQAALESYERRSEAERSTFRFVHISTDEVYGALGSTGIFTETTPYAPNSPYSASKASSDHLVRAWHRTYGLPVNITHCSNNYGPYQYPEKLIPLVTLNAVEGKRLPVYGKGENVRDWLFVEDHVTALLAVAERGRVGEVYNIGGGNEIRNIDIVRTICAVLDELRPRKEGPHESLIEFVKDRPGHDFRYAIEIAKIERETGWKPAWDMARGLRATLEWYLANGDWCAAVQHGKYDRQRLGSR